MVLAIDASRANKKIKTGVEWYSYYLIQHLKKVIPSNIKVVLYSSTTLPGALSVMPSNWELKILRWPFKYLWTTFRLAWEVWRRPVDILFLPASGLPIYVPPNTVNTVHDVGFERFPKLYQRRVIWYHRWNVRRALYKCSAIFTISKWSEQEIGNFYKKPRAKVFMIPLAADEHFITRPQDEEIDKVKESYAIRTPYFIYVGRVEQKKNICRIAEAFAEFSEEQSKEYKLLFVGPPGYGAVELQKFIKERKIDHLARNIPWVPGEKLAALMAGAEALVFPTLYEGFGLPILEAMNVGTPVVTSNRGANLEVAGGAALLVDPENVSEIKEAMVKLITDNELRVRLILDGRRRSAEFSWTRTAEETWEVIAGIMSTGGGPTLG